MNYHSEEYDDRENKILEDSEESRQRHAEVEKRYKRLVEKKAVCFNMEESLAILRQEYGIEFNDDMELPRKSPVKISIEDEENVSEEISDDNSDKKDALEVENKTDVSDTQNENNADESEHEKESENEEKSFEATNEEKCENLGKDLKESIETEKDFEKFKEIENRFREAFPEDGRFKAFYEENIEPLLSDPEFGEIRDFIYEEADFSNEKYDLVLKAFEEKTGISYGDSSPEADIHPVDELQQMPDGAKMVHAVPIENEKDVSISKKNRAGTFYMGASLAGIVILIGALVVYSIW